jgi:hypothetical protein
MQHPTKHIIVTIFKNRRYRYPSRDWWLSTYSSGMFRNDLSQLNLPSGSSFDFSLDRSLISYGSGNGEMRSTNSGRSVSKNWRGRYTLANLGRKIKNSIKKIAATKATGIKVDIKLDRDEDVPVVLVDFQFHISNVLCDLNSLRTYHIGGGGYNARPRQSTLVEESAQQSAKCQIATEWSGKNLQNQQLVQAEGGSKINAKIM